LDHHIVKDACNVFFGTTELLREEDGLSREICIHGGRLVIEDKFPYVLYYGSRHFLVPGQLADLTLSRFVLVDS